MARILLADDDKATRDLVKRALEQDGHVVDICQDGTEALEKLTAQSGEIDVLVSDVHMPGINGIELAGRVIESAPKIKLLLMSGFSEELDRARSLASPYLDVLIKPFTLEQIRASVRALLA